MLNAAYLGVSRKKVPIMDLRNLTEKELLQHQAEILNELTQRGVIRTQNNPLGDYTEWLVANALGLELQPNARAGYDGLREDGARFQIKGRRITPANRSRQLSTIRNFEEGNFEYLAAVVYNEHFDVIEALLIPHEVVGEYAQYREYVNGHILHVRGAILVDQRVEHFENMLRS